VLHKPSFLLQETEELLSKLIQDPNYSSASKTQFYHLISEKYPWIDYRDVSEFLEGRLDYKMHKAKLISQKKFIGRKPNKHKYESEKRQHKTAIYAMKPNHKWQIDIAFPFPYGSVKNNNFTCVLTIIDVFSKYAFAIPLRDKKGETVANWLDFIFRAHQAPVFMLSDNGKEFLNKSVSEVLDKFKVKHITNQPYEPLGIIERFNQTFKRHITQIDKVTNDLELDKLVEIALKRYNSIPHASHKYPPSEVHFSTDPVVRWNARKILMNKYNKSNDAVIPHKVGMAVGVNAVLWPDLDKKIKQDLHNQGKLRGVSKVLFQHNLKPDDIRVFIIRAVYVIPNSNPPVYLYQLSSSEEPRVDFHKYYLHHQLISL